MIVQHCQIPGRGKCGRTAIVWVDNSYESAYNRQTVSRIQAACAEHAKGRAELGPVELQRRAS